MVNQFWNSLIAKPDKERGRKGKADRQNLQTNQKTVNGDMFGQFPIVLQIQAAEVFYSLQISSQESTNPLLWPVWC